MRSLAFWVIFINGSPRFFDKFGKSGIEDMADFFDPIFDIFRLYRIEPLQ